MKPTSLIENPKLISHANFWAIFLISFSILVFEITLTKIFSITLWYHFSYLVVSLTMFGLGLGGLVVYLLRDHFKFTVKGPLSLEDSVYYLALLLGISIIISLHCAVTYFFPPVFTWLHLLDAILRYLICTFPFMLSSMIIAIFFMNCPKQSNAIYGYDLLGAAFACIASVVLISFLSAQQVVLIAALAALVASCIFNRHNRVWFALVLIIGTILLAFNAPMFFNITLNKSRYLEQDHVIYQKWSPLARITVCNLSTDTLPFAWGLSTDYQWKIFNHNNLWIEQDASAGSPIVGFDGDFKKVDYLQHDITALPYHLKKDADVFILGVGGGRDVLTALSFNNKHITGVDIHPLMMQLLKETFSNISGNLDKIPGVKLHVSEGRRYLAEHKDLYDIIQVPLIDSWAATVAGAFAMSENSLYTTEAFETYLQFLKPNGMLSVSRFYYEPDNQSIKVAILARRALELQGSKHPKDHVVVVRSNVLKKPDVATLLIKKTPFTTEEIKAIQAVSQRLGFPVLYAPQGQNNDPRFNKAMQQENLEQFLEENYYDLRPNTDDRPFFFQMFYFSNIKDLLTGAHLTGQFFNFYGVAVIVCLFGISVLLLSLFYGLPWVFSKDSRQLPRSWVGYFSSIGLGFMLVEIPSLQLISVYLGGPMYGLSVGLFLLLFFAGLGSLVCNRLSTVTLIKVLRLSLWMVVAQALVWPFILHGIIDYGFGHNWYLKALIITCLMFPMATCMGIALPSSLRLVPVHLQPFIPWLWAINGAASVLGSILAMGVAMIWGYRYSFFAASILYLFASLQLARARKTSNFS